MMKKVALLSIFTLYSIVSLAGNQIDSLLNVLDKTIKESKAYVEIREKRINNLKRQLNKKRSRLDKFIQSTNCYIKNTELLSVIQRYII
jgi:hypothetical protein